MTQRPVRALLAQRIIDEMNALVAAGHDGDDLLIALNGALPDITYHEFVAALILHRAETGADGYTFIPAGRLQ